ncbi:Enolase 2 [bacterium HR36]|nr:Enolase 2 [bacterium HR36]
MARITEVRAREVLDSRGQPTVEAEVICSDGIRGRALAPAGASRGSAEAWESRDNEAERFGGRGVRQAVRAIQETVSPALRGMCVTDQAKVDERLVELDGTINKKRLGGNAIVAVSLAVAQAAAHAHRLPLYQSLVLSALDIGYLCRPAEGADYLLPMPMVNMISGGLHAGRHLEVQDFLIIPQHARSFAEAIEIIYTVHRSLGNLLRAQGYEADLVADEGGYGPRLRTNEEAIELILSAVKKSGLREANDVVLALDIAASHFYNEGLYELTTLDRKLDSAEWIEQLLSWVKVYPIVSLEDPLAENDWAGWSELMKKLGNRIQIIGDDLFATNLQRLRRGITQGIANAVLIKPNQAGTLTETFLVMREAQQVGYRRIISARSGDTEETWLADLAVATGAGQIKIGCITRSERLAKYNQLLRLEEELGERARLARPFA